MVFGLEGHLGQTIDLKHPIITWIVTHAGYVISHFQVGKCGKTPYERLKGKSSKTELCEVGEKVMYMPLKSKNGMASMSERYKPGIWLGVNEKNGELHIATESGLVVGSRSIRRLPESAKWDKDMVEKIRATPWNHNVPEEQANVTFGPTDKPDIPEPVPMHHEPEIVPRRMRIHKRDLEEHGYLDGCPGCQAAKAKMPTRNHSEACRNRLMEALRTTEHGRQRIDEAVGRIFDYVAKRDQPDSVPRESHPVPAEGGQEQQIPSSNPSNPSSSHEPARPSVNRTDEQDDRSRNAKRTMQGEHEDATGSKYVTIEEELPEDCPESVRAAILGKGPPQTSDHGGVRHDDTEIMTDQPAGQPDNTSGDQMDDAHVDALRAIAMVREPLIPAKRNLEKMRQIAEIMNVVKWEAKDFLEKMQLQTVGTMDMNELWPKTNDTQFMGLRMPYAKYVQETSLLDSSLCPFDEHDTGSNGGQPPVTDEPGRVSFNNQEIQTGPKAKPLTGNRNKEVKLKNSTWERLDWWCTHNVTTTAAGPKWQNVHRRKVYDMDTNELIEDVSVEHDFEEKEYQYVLSVNEDTKKPRNLRTILEHRSPPDVCEVYSPPRITAEANKSGLKGGFAFDLTVKRPDGKPWDFSIKANRDEAVRKVINEEPLFVIGSPPCTMFSILQNGNKHRHSPAAWQAKLDAAEVHIKFCLTLYEIQRRAGRYYLHEHPRTATSWALESVQKFMKHPDTICVHSNMCRFGMTTTMGGKVGLVREAITFMTNSTELATRLDRRCSKECRESTQHLPIWGARAREAQVYPQGLCRTVTEGIRAQKEVDQRRLCGIELADLGIHEDDASATRYDSQHDEQEEQRWWRAWDDVTGQELEPAEVRKARKAEMEYMNKMKVYTVCPVEECIKATGRPPIGTRWIDINKGDAETKNYRSRWVAQQFKKGEDWEMFSATPPLEAVRYIISVCASSKNKRLMINDISRAYLFADVREAIYVKLPEEADGGGDPNKCARLLKSLYGTRSAASNWAECYTELLMKNGFTRAKSNPCLFHHRGRDILTMVHGDDFLSTADGNGLDWMESILKKELEVKTERCGPAKEQGYKSQVRFLNRVISWESHGIRYEPDPRHAEIIVNQMGVAGAKSVSTPGITATAPRSEDDAENPKLMGQEASDYRGVAARANFLAMDRMDIQYASKEISRWMATPRRSDWEGLKRLARYLVGVPRMTAFYKWQSMPMELRAYSDTDWAGCKNTRRSTSGGIVMHGDHWIKSWSKTQTLVSLSSAEAELYGTVRASSELLGIRSMARDYGRHLSGRLYADANAALGIIHRLGLGKVRHLETNTLWIQQAARTKLIQYLKIPGQDNPADTLTKHLPVEPRVRHCQATSLETLPGRPEIAPMLNPDSLQSLIISRPTSDTSATTTRAAKIEKGHEYVERKSGKGIGCIEKIDWAEASRDERGWRS